jgi:hypothetical protein
MEQTFKVPICKRHNVYSDFMFFSIITLLLALMFFEVIMVLFIMITIKSVILQNYFSDFFISLFIVISGC